jgi:hypothetical protein
MKVSPVVALFCLAIASTATALATPIDVSGTNGEASLQSVLDGITCTTTSGACTLGGPSSVDVVTDQVTPDAAWALSGGNGSGQIVVELAGYASINAFGIYDLLDHSRRVQLFSGAAGAGSSVSFNIDALGNVSRNGSALGVQFGGAEFGFYLSNPYDVWFSDSLLNSDGADHMVAYQGVGDRIRLPGGVPTFWGPDAYILGWEDLASSRWDRDYNDFVVMVQGVHSVPEPGTLALLGLGLAGLGLARRRRTGDAAA